MSDPWKKGGRSGSTCSKGITQPQSENATLLVKEPEMSPMERKGGGLALEKKKDVIRQGGKCPSNHSCGKTILAVPKIVPSQTGETHDSWKRNSYVVPCGKGIGSETKTPTRRKSRPI